MQVQVLHQGHRKWTDQLLSILFIHPLLYSDNAQRSDYEETVSDEGWRRTTSEDVQTGHSRLVIESLKSRIQQLVSMMMDIMMKDVHGLSLGNHFSVSTTMFNLSRGPIELS